MKKRILALALACLMLVSMFPMAIFADDDCTHANSTLIEDKPAEGCKEGYKLWLCNDCEKTYMTDIVPESHHWIKQTDVSATCYSDGKKDYSICDRCNEEDYEPVEKNTVVKHDFSVATDTYEGDKRVYKCKACDATQVGSGTDGVDPQHCSKLVNGEHTWANVVPEIDEEPSDTDNGVAIFTCEVCKYSEEVVIHTHNYTVHKATEADCDNPAYVRYVSCSICNQKFLSEADAKIFKACSDEDIINTEINGGEKLGHAWEASNIRNYVASDCENDVHEKYEQWCTRCEQYVERDLGVSHTYGYLVNVPATCMNKGLYYNVCSVCGDKYQAGDNAMDTPALTDEHEAYVRDDDASDVTKLYGYLFQYDSWYIADSYVGTEAENTVVNSTTDGYKPTCTKSATIIIKCTECPGTKEVIINALGHNVVTETVYATCGTYKFTYKVCKNEGCNLMTSTVNTELNTLMGEGNKTLIYKDADTSDDGVSYVADNDVKCIANSVTVLEDAGFNASAHKVNAEVREAATCTTKGLKVEYCMFCGNYSDTAVEFGPNGHDMPSADVEDDATYITKNMEKKCTETSQHIFYDLYKCKDCDYTEERNIRLHTYKTMYDSLEEAQTYHTLISAVHLRPADCSKGHDALTQYTCSTCAKKIIVADAGSGDHTKPEDYAGEVDATCEANAYYPEYTCTVCDTKVAKEVVAGTKLSHNFDHKDNVVQAADDAECKRNGWLKITKCTNGCQDYKTNGKVFATEALARAEAWVIAHHANANNFTKVARVENDCVNVGNVAYWTCKKCNKNWTPVSGDLVSAYNKENNFPTVEITDTVLPAKNHKFTAAVAERTAVCGGVFGYAFYNCENDGCDEQYIVDYTALQHVKGDKLTGEGSYQAPGCETDGFQKYECKTTAGCVITDTINALGHINAAEDNLSDCANNDVEDRVCTREDVCEKNNGEIDTVAHDYAVANVERTCTTDGYTAEVCRNCHDIKANSITITEQAGHTIGGGSYWQVIENVTQYPTADKAGAWVKKCSECDFEEKGERAGVALSMTATNAVNPGKAYTDATLVKVTVSVSGLPKTTVVGGLQFDIVTSGIGVNYSHCAAADGFDVATAGVTAGNTVTVTVLSAKGVTVNAATAAVDVYFVVNSVDAGDAYFTIAYGDDSTSTATDTAAEADYWVAQYSDKGYAAQTKITTVKLLDTNGDDVIDVKDLVNLYGISKSAESATTKYNSVIDLDRDGDITWTDLELLNSIITAANKNEAYDKIVGRYVAPTNPNPAA